MDRWDVGGRGRDLIFWLFLQYVKSDLKKEEEIFNSDFTWKVSLRKKVFFVINFFEYSVFP